LCNEISAPARPLPRLSLTRPIRTAGSESRRVLSGGCCARVARGTATSAPTSIAANHARTAGRLIMRLPYGVGGLPASITG
jgi:hypothetical protein